MVLVPAGDLRHLQIHQELEIPHVVSHTVVGRNDVIVIIAGYSPIS